MGAGALRHQQHPDERRADQRRALPDVPPVQGAGRDLRSTGPASSTTPGGPGRLSGPGTRPPRRRRRSSDCARGDRAPSLIVTLHRGNATADKLPADARLVAAPRGMGITSARLHILESRKRSRARRLRAHDRGEHRPRSSSFADLEPELTTCASTLQRHAQPALGTDDNTTCIWNACDPYTTRAVRGVEGHGQSQQLRPDQQGRHRLREVRRVEGFERYLALYHTPQEARRLPGLPVLPDVQGPVPGHGDRRRLAQPDRALRPLEGALPGDGGAVPRRRPNAHLGQPRARRARGRLPRAVGGGRIHFDRRCPALARAA